MATGSKRKKDKGKKIISRIKKNTALFLGSVVAVAGLFAVSRAIDFFVWKTEERRPQKLLPFEKKVSPAPRSIHSTSSQNSPSSLKLSFYEELPKNEPDTAIIHSDAQYKKQPTETNQNSQEAHAAAKQGAPEKPPAGTGYVLQLGAFQRRETAAALVNDFKKKGYSPYMVTPAVPGKDSLTRVRIGIFKDLPEAKKKAAEIRSKTNIQVRIIKQ